jgi:lipopolysaccharide transport system permease protein
MRDPSRWRIGARAVLVDLAVAALAMVLAYQLRFGADEALHFMAAAAPVLFVVLLLQSGLSTILKLYRIDGQAMWPVRLGIGAISGAALTLAAASWLGIDDGVSRQAVAIQSSLLCLSGVLWRAVVGLKVRQYQAAAIREQFGGQELVVQGEDVGSMAGSLGRTLDYRHLLWNIVAKDLKLKYQRSLLGFTWSLLNPLMMIGVYTLAFTYVMKLPTPRFALFILIGLLSWNFFAGAVMSATEAVAGQGSLLRSVVFPRVVLPFSAVLFHLVQYLLSILVFLPIVLFVYGVAPSPQMLLFPVFLLLQVLFITGLTLALSTASAAFRDIKHLVEVGLSIGFWLTPIIYEPTMVPEQFREVALLAPMTSYVRAYQDIFYYGSWPDPSIWIVASVYAAGAFVCGLSVFLAYESSMPELA